MRWVAVLLFIPSLLAQPTAVQVVGITPTQLLLSYRAPDLSRCTLSATNLNDPTERVYDLDASKFPSADSDLRHTWNVGAQNRVVIIGRRTSDTATDGKLYSRALEADAPYRITISCTGGSATLDTATDWVPAGDMFPENPPFNADGLGNYAWPTIDWQDRTRSYIDPMTGVKLKLATRPGDWANRATGKFGSKLWADFSTLQSWREPQNAGLGDAISTSTYAGPGNEALFVGVDPKLTSSNRLYGGWGGGEYPWSVDDFGVHVIGSGTDAAPSNRTVSVCLTIDSGQSCYSRAFDVVLPINQAADTGLIPANFPSPMFGGWGKAIPRMQLPITGTVDIAGNLVSLKEPVAGSSFFNPELAPGSKLYVAGSQPTCLNNLCTVAEVVDGTHVLVRETLQITNAAAIVANFGVRIVKTTPIGSISLSLTYENAWSFPSTMPPTGNTEMCGRMPVSVSVDASGAKLPDNQVLTGYNCAISGSWYWISSDTGESRLISVTIPPLPSEFAGWDARDIPNLLQSPPGIAAFDPQSPNTAYAYASLAGGGHALFKLTYTGDYRALNYNYPSGGGGELPATTRDFVQWTNLTPKSQAKDPDSQVRARFPNYDATRWGAITDFRGVSGDYAMFLNTIGGQDTACWIFLFNIRTQVLEYTFNTWDGTFHPLLRWQACHSGFAGSISDTASLANKPMYVRSSSARLGGPFESAVTGVLRTNGQFDANTSLNSDPDGTYQSTCPTNLDTPYTQLGGQPLCVTIRVNGEPCSSYASAQEAAQFPCPWDPSKSMLQTMQVGDYVAESTPNAYDHERLIIVKKTLVGSQIELVLYRFPPPFCGMLPDQRVHASGWRIAMAASGPDTCETGFTVIDIPSGTVRSESRLLLGGHLDLGTGASPKTFSFVGIGSVGPEVTGAGYEGVYAIRENMGFPDIGTSANGYVQFDPKFSGIAGLSATALQSYASKHQWNASAEDLRWALDFRHLNGPYGFAFENTYTNLGATVASPVAGTKNVYRISILGNTDLKRIPLLGFAGRFLLSEKSSPAKGNTLTDADPYRFCVAYLDGECRQGSKVGQAFVSVPAASLNGWCQTAQYARNIPCVATNHPLGAWAIQFDTTQRDLTGSSIRRLTMGLSGPGRQYAYGNLRALPDGKWALMSGWWLDGLRLDILLVKIPQLHPDTVLRGRRMSVAKRAARNDLVPLDIAIRPRSGATHAVIDFGYQEYGDAGRFLCTPRQESCVAANTGISSSNPFLYASELVRGVECTSGCTIQVPALAARMLFYRVRYLDADGRTVATSPLQIRPTTEERLSGGASASTSDVESIF